MTPTFNIGDKLTFNYSKPGHPKEIFTVENISERMECYFIVTVRNGIRIRRRLRFEKQNTYTKI